MNIFFSGIGGVGLGPLAEMARDAGYSVQGSDLSESLMTQHIRSLGIAVEITQDGTFLQAAHELRPVDWFVYTAALPDDHPELVLARQLGMKVTKRDELLAHIIQDKNLKLIAVSGTHGKTTTTGMMVWAMQQRGIPVSYSVGTTLSFGPSGKFDPDSEYFVYECDEFDRNMLHFSPHLSLITSLGYDHSDTYASKSDYQAAFSQFIQQSAHTIGWKVDIGSLPDLPAEKSWQLEPDDIIDIPLAGELSRRNATLVAKAFEYLKLGDCHDVLALFPGTNRRFEKLADNLYSDYGHHPTEIAATLQMARELSDSVVLIYQPHQNVRQHELKDEYGTCFELAEKVYWLPTYLSREDPDLEILSPAALIANIPASQHIEVADLNNELWQRLRHHLNDGKLVLCMGAGSIDCWVRSKVDHHNQ